MSVYITDYVTNPDLETEVLGNLISESKETAEVLLVWHQEINASYLGQFKNLKGVVNLLANPFEDRAISTKNQSDRK